MLISSTGLHERLNADAEAFAHAVDVAEEGDVVGGVGDVAVGEALGAEVGDVGGGHLARGEGELLGVGEEGLGGLVD